MKRLFNISVAGTLFAAATLIAAAIAEGAARLAGFAPRQLNVNRFFVPGTETTWSEPDSELGWINKAGVSKSVEAGEARMTFWSHGRRATRNDETPPSHRFPIMIVGGSNAQAYGVADADSFPFRLSARFPEAWIENFGGGGYSTVQAAMAAERALRDFYRETKPRLVALGFDDSHILRNVADQSWVYSISDSAGHYVAPPHFRMKKGGPQFVPFATIGFWPFERQSALVTIAHNTWLQSFAYNTAREGPAATHAALRQLQATAENVGADFLVVILEDRSRRASQLLAGAPFQVLDCSGPERSDPQRFLLGGNSHPTAELHAHYADCIAPVIEGDVQ